MDFFCSKSSRFKPYVGKKLAVCYDGKWSRAKIGIVTCVNRRYFKVKFIPWANEGVGEVELNIARRKSSKSYGGWLIGEGELGILASLGCRGDWYSVLPIELLLENNFKIDGLENF
jgi:hypothetical protein